jgi:hypothetical protein
LIAFRELAAKPEALAAGVVTHLDRARGPLRACLVYVLLVNPLAAGIDADLKAAIERASTADTLVPFASGAFSVMQFHPADLALVSRAKLIILHVRQRAAQLGAPLSVDESLRFISGLAGVAP